jgi:hypothetical protein
MLAVKLETGKEITTTHAQMEDIRNRTAMKIGGAAERTDLIS